LLVQKNGRCESFNSRLRDELLNGELFQSIAEAQVLHERYRQEYNHFSPHSALGYLTPEEFKDLPTSSQRAVLAGSATRRDFYAKEFWGYQTRSKLTLVS